MNLGLILCAFGRHRWRKCTDADECVRCPEHRAISDDELRRRWRRDDQPLPRRPAWQADLEVDLKAFFGDDLNPPGSGIGPKPPV